MIFSFFSNVERLAMLSWLFFGVGTQSQLSFNSHMPVISLTWHYSDWQFNRGLTYPGLIRPYHTMEARWIQSQVYSLSKRQQTLPTKIPNMPAFVVPFVSNTETLQCSVQPVMCQPIQSLTRMSVDQSTTRQNPRCQRPLVPDLPSYLP